MSKTTMRAKMSFGLSALTICVALLTASQGQADEVGNFYRGKTIELDVGFGPSGGNDLWARAIANYMPRHIPGDPTMIVKNVPAAGSLVLANNLANTAPRDGTVIGTIDRGIPFEPLFGDKSVQFDPLKFNYIGSPSRDSNMCAVRSDRPIKTAQDMFTHQIVMGSSGTGAESYIFPLILKNLVGANVKIINGYDGSQSILLAIERGELDGLCLGTQTVLRTAQYKNGRFRIFLQMGIEPDPVLGDLPLVSDFVKKPDDRAVLDLIFARINVGRPFLAPPDVPKDRVEALRKAFATTLKEPDFQAAVAKMNLDITAISGEELEKVIRGAYQTPANIVKRTAEFLGP